MIAEPAFIEWSEVLAVGHQGLDAEHQRLAQAISEIYTAEVARQTLDQINPFLDSLLIATAEHFRHENSVMRAIGDRASASQASIPSHLKGMTDAVIHEHVTEHAQAFAKLESIICDFSPGSSPNEQKLSQNLKGWFIEHVIKYDAHLKAVFQAM
jgi:hemerythrin-like metal-binding protein